MTAICINLDSRPDRWELAKQECEKIFLDVKRLPAVFGDNRPLAFNQSVYLAMTLSEGLDLLLIEDDVVFDHEAQIGRIDLEFLISKRPKDALTIHFGCNIFGSDIINWKMPEKHNETFAKIHNCWQSHCTWYSKEAVSYILANLNPNVLDGNNMIFDEWLRKNVLSQGRSYVTRPMVAYQRPSFSDLWNRDTDYTGCHYAGNKWLKQNT